MATQHQLLASINQFSPVSVYARQCSSPHHSPSLDMNKPMHHAERWVSGSPTPAYPMANTTSMHWGVYAKQQQPQQRLPTTPPMHSHLGDYSAFPSPTPTHHYGSMDNDYHDHGLSMASVQHPPLSPPVSEGYMSPDMSNQGHQAWLHYGIKSEATNIPLLDSSPLLGINAYSTDNLTSTQQTPNMISERKKFGEGLSPEKSGPQTQRKKRRLTEPEAANYHCQICGKYFSRVWNYNAHRETHDPSRPKPHTCHAENCGKAFVRRTDLTRHVQCVHAKEKKFQCSLCNNRFARKDTLRRHEDDGCPKRVDIQSRNNKSSSTISWTSWALRCPPPIDYFSFTGGARPQHQPQPTFDGASSSFLPPLSVALQNDHHSQQTGMLMS